MSVFAWKAEYSLGIEEMDRQHEEIFRLLTDLEAAVSAAREATLTRALVESVRRHSGLHFETEERLLDRVHFPGIVQQRVQHRRFIERLREAETAASGHGLSIEEVQGLQSWILGHVVGLDREYLPFLGGDSPGGRR